MLSDRLGEIIVPMVTPFRRSDAKVDLAVVEELVEHLVSKNYCDTIMAAGTTGEFSTLSFEERIELFRVVKSANSGRKTIAAGTGAASTWETVKITQKAEDLGYEFAMVVAPYYCRPDQEGIYQHFKTVAENTRLQILLYNIPLFTGVNIDPPTVGRLSQIQNIAGIKEEAGLNPTQMTEYRLAADSIFTVYDGDDIMVLCGLVQGASGVVSGGSHLIGDKMREMIRAFKSGDQNLALKVHCELDPFFKSLSPPEGVNPIPGLKAAIEMAGIPVGPPRLPLSAVSDKHREKIKEQIRRLGVI